MNILVTIAKPFIGSGIGRRLPWLHDAYRTIYAKQPKTVFSVRLPNKLKLSVPNDSGPGLYLATTGTYEPLATQLFIASIKPNDTVFDIGAHVGYYTLIAASLMGAKGHVVAFEPAAENVLLLKQNVSQNKLNRRVTVVPKAVDSKSGQTKLYLSNSSSGDHTLEKVENCKSVRVSAISLDEAVRAYGTIPSVIKIDVEGAEYRVLGGMKKTIASKKLHTLFIEINANNPHPAATIKTLRHHGFTVDVIDERRQLLLELTDEEILKFVKTYGYVNCLATR